MSGGTITSGNPRRSSAPSSPVPSSEHEAAREALALAFRLHARIVATSVLEAVGSIEVAYAAAHIAHSPTFDAFTGVLRYLGHPHAEGDEGDTLLEGVITADPDWSALAAAGGLPFDADACRQHLNGRPIWADIEADPTFEVPFALADLTSNPQERTPC